MALDYNRVSAPPPPLTIYVWRKLLLSLLGLTEPWGSLSKQIPIYGRSFSFPGTWHQHFFFPWLQLTQLYSKQCDLEVGGSFLSCSHCLQVGYATSGSLIILRPDHSQVAHLQSKQVNLREPGYFPWPRDRATMWRFCPGGDTGCKNRKFSSSL